MCTFIFKILLVCFALRLFIVVSVCTSSECSKGDGSMIWDHKVQHPDLFVFLWKCGMSPSLGLDLDYLDKYNHMTVIFVVCLWVFDFLTLQMLGICIRSYKWGLRRWSLEKRLFFFETNWAFFAGFGGCSLLF